MRLCVNVAGTNWVVSSPRSLKSHFGRWVHLVAVYDGPGRTAALYLNGKRVASRAIADPVPLILDDVELGNWNPLLNPPSTIRERRDRHRPSFFVRNFHGRMDEFALLSRPLSAEETRRLYEAGRPRHDAVASAK